MTDLRLKIKSVFSSRKRLVAIFAGGFVWSFFLVAAAYGYYRYQTHDRLIAFAPVNTIFYASVREPVWPEKNLPSSDLPLDGNLLRFSPYLPLDWQEIKNDLLPLTRRAALVVFANDANELESVLLFELKAATGKLPLPALKNFGWLNQRVFAAASSPAALVAVQETGQGALYSLTTQIDRRQIGRGCVNAFISAANLKASLGSNSDFFLRLASRLLPNDLFFSASLKKEAWKFLITGGSFQALPRPRPALDALPSDFQLYISGISPLTLINSWQTADPAWAQTWQQVTAFYASFYGQSRLDLLADFLSRPADILIFNQLPDNFSASHWLLAFPDASEAERHELKELVLAFLAVQTPQSAKRVLPDGTAVTEYFAQPQTWSWVKGDESRGAGVEYLKVPELGWELALVKQPKGFWFSNSPAHLEDMLRQPGRPFASLDLPCHLPAPGGSLMLFRHLSPATSSLALWPRSLFLELKGRGQIKGCFGAY